MCVRRGSERALPEGSLEATLADLVGALMLALAQDFADRVRDAKAPLREFLAWQVSKRQV